ncbi:MAG: ATP-binding protein [Gemmatimonadota bacterium]
MTAPESPAPDFLHDAIMDAVVFAAELFLGGGDWHANLDLVLARLGEAAGVSRAYIHERSVTPAGNTVTRRAEWVGTGVEPQIDNPALRDLSLAASGLPAWEEGLDAGRIMQANVDGVPREARRLMAPQSIESIVNVPIHVDGEWWGFIGFDECRSERVWTMSELSALRAAGELLGAAIGRRRLEASIEEQRRQARLQADVGALVTAGGLGDGAFAERCVRLLVDRLEVEYAGLWEADRGGEHRLLAGRGRAEEPLAPEAIDAAAVTRAHPDDPVTASSWASERGLSHAAAFPLLVGEERVGAVAILDARPITDIAREALWSVSDEIALALKQGASIRQLRGQEERIRALVATAPDGILVVDEGCRVVSVNAALEAMLGATAAELAGREIGALLPERSRGEFLDGLRGYMETGRRDPDWTSRDWSWATADGREIPVEVSFGEYQDGGRRFFTGFVRDVTDRRRAEENARTLIREQAARSEAEAAHRRSEFLSEASRALATSFDYTTTLASLVQLAVPEIADYGWVDVLQDGDTLRRVGVAHVDPQLEPVILSLLRQAQDYQEDSPPLARVFDEGTAVSMPDVDLEELLEAAPDEDYRTALRKLDPVSCLAVPVRVRDRTVAAIVLSYSFSGRRYDREDLALARDLAARAALAVENAELYMQALEAKRGRDAVLGVVAHDLRNPLNTIGMAGQALEETSDHMFQRYGGAIRRSVSLMNRLIGDLLEARELDGGALRLQLRREDPWHIAEEAIATLQPIVAAKELTLSVKHAGEPCGVDVDHVRILQVISNLVGNAVKFTPAGGAIEIQCEAEPELVRFSVRDTGPGIPAEQLPHVFGRFWKADAEDRRGIGLGLAIAEGIVHAHHGRIWVESEPGCGATFYFTLPKPPPEAAPPTTRVVVPIS